MATVLVFYCDECGHEDIVSVTCPSCKKKVVMSFCSARNCLIKGKKEYDCDSYVPKNGKNKINERRTLEAKPKDREFVREMCQHCGEGNSMYGFDPFEISFDLGTLHSNCLR